MHWKARSASCSIRSPTTNARTTFDTAATRYAKVKSALVPLCTDAGAFHDDRIVGTYRLAQKSPPNKWKPIITVGGDDVVRVTISKQPARYKVVFQREERSVTFNARLTKIGDDLYIDLQSPRSEDPAMAGTTLRLHFVVRCTITDDGLRLSGADSKQFRAKLTELGLPVADVDAYTVYAGTTEQLRDAISAHGAELFPLTEQDPWLTPLAAHETSPVKAGSRESITLKDVSFVFRWCPPGEFMMGSPKPAEEQYGDAFVPQHRVSISRGFWIQETEVTQAQYKMVMGKNPSFWTEFGRKSANPVESVTWNDAVRFCEALSKLDPDHDYRLPTEAEWEYACRAGQPDCRYGEINEIAWVFETTDAGHGSSGHRPVGKKKPNRWGLHDMFGNVAEWCSDWHGPAATKPTTDPRGPLTGKLRIVRGDDCFADAGFLRTEGACMAGSRGASRPADASRTIGFRVVRIPAARPD
jgi:formylglycine-generating enzyme required for sulfatase activity